MSDNIKVVVKVRPLILREIEDNLFYQWRINNNTLQQIDQNERECGPSFTFDKVYDTETRTDSVYNNIAKPIVEAAVAGFNGTIFAYGQTSSGKTYTMTGTDDAPGIIPLAVVNLFDIIKSIPDRDFLVRVSYVEIYNESLIDLLDLKKKVKIHDTLQGIKVCTTEKLTISPEEVLELMRQGKANRQTGATNMNEESSRSHSIFQITIESREHKEGEEEGPVNVSQLNLVDLAGSERSGQTGATGIRFKEGTHINKSLSSLALVIKQLSEDPNKHVNYRDSKLTRILQNSLGGNAKTSIICAVTPAAVEETISTLQFANRAKAIKNTPAVNLVTTDSTMIQTLTKQLSSLKTQLESKKNVEQDNYNLQNKIAHLQKMILNGFGQNRSTDMISTARRKLIKPRRVTISTLHPIQEDPAPQVPKFCTPSLKYNPAQCVSPPRSLLSVCESPPREGVIVIDSDEESTSDIKVCSPYHECYKSKTPPCVLRKNAQQAEKNLKDIVELTEREKIFPPNVVELMEKLDEKYVAIAKLEDDIHNLHTISKEKDVEMERLKSKITEAEEEIKNMASVKATLETTCSNYSTKITDWEVSYETLKKKARNREEELLSLLKEQETKKKNEPIGKLSSKAVEKELKNFMDMSRDISLVNSSIDNSIIETTTRPNLNTEISNLKTLIESLNVTISNQKTLIDTLLHEKNDMTHVEKQLTMKFTEIQEENKELVQKVSKLEVLIKNKEGMIESLKKDKNGTRENIEKIKLGLTKVQTIITLLTGDINEIPEFVDNLVVAVSLLGNKLTNLESIAKDTIKEKENVIAKLEQTEIEFNTFHKKIYEMSDTLDVFYNEHETLVLESKEDGLTNGGLKACDVLANKINNLLSMIKTIQEVHSQKICNKDSEINELKISDEIKSKELHEGSEKNKTLMQEVCDLTTSRNLFLKNIFENVSKVMNKFGIENNISCQFENACENVYEQVIITIDKIDNYISLLTSEHSKCDQINNALIDAKNQILQLTEENITLIQNISDLETDKDILSEEINKIQEESKRLTNDLQGANHLLKQLRHDLITKSSEMEIMEKKAKSWKDSFTDLKGMMQDKVNILASGDQEYYFNKPNIQVNSPPTLLTICCKKIADAIDLTDDKSVTSSSSCTELSDSKISKNKCNCDDLLTDLHTLAEEKNKLNITIERLHNENKDLLKERDDVQKEVQLLLEHSYELQKRVVNHRTILSTLTATTYAENKSLHSQIKFLQHHHSRFHHVCQKVIPTFKRQLYDLMTLLKSECLGKHNESFKRYSLPNALDTSSLHSTLKNESIFDNDLLMLDTNVTLTTCDNTIIPHDQTCFDVTPVWTSNEVAWQTNCSEVTKDALYPQMGLERLDENQILETLESLKTENNKLRDLVDSYTKNQTKVLVTTVSSPIKFPDRTEITCKKCNQYVDDIRVCEDSYKKEIDAMSKKLSDLKCENNNISEKCRELALELSSREAFVQKLSSLEKELQIKINDLDRLTVTLSKTNKNLNNLQKENHNLSNEIMENISEIDDLKIEKDTLKESNTKLTEKCLNLEKELKSYESQMKQTLCNDCVLKEETINCLQKRLLVTDTHSKLDRSFSDADSSSRYNKICTLQNELHAGKEDCIELREEVTTIKEHLEHGNLSQNMELDESIIESNLQAQFNKIKEEESAALRKDLKEKDSYLQKIAEIVSHIRVNISVINAESESEDALMIFRNSFLKIVDTEFGLPSSNIFESIIQQLNEKHNMVIERNTTEIEQLKDTTQRMGIELNSVNDSLSSLKSLLNEKESEFELLRKQKEKTHEISNAVTIDIIKKDKELRCQLNDYCRKLLENNIVIGNIDLSLPLTESLNILFNTIFNELGNKKSEIEKLTLVISELEKLKVDILQKDKDFITLKDDLKSVVNEYEQKLITQISLHDDLNKIYVKKVEENEINANAITKLTEEINILKGDMSKKDVLLKSLETKHSKDLLERQSEQIEVLKNLQNVQKELEDLKIINQNILTEKEACAIELDSVKSVLSQNKLEIAQFVSEIDKLKHLIQDNSQVIDNLKNKSDTLLEENNLLQKQLQEKCTNCARLALNIKTHEKTASIQINIINRLQTQKADLVTSNSEKDKQIEAMAQKCKSLEQECMKLTTEITTAKEEIEKLNSLKQTMELRMSELESLDKKPRLSIDSVAGTSRLRRQSIHDSKRIFDDDVQDHKKHESRSKTDDLFMDIDEDSSNRSTPIRLSRGRESMLSKHEQSDKDEEPVRAGSAAAARRRRRTAHDTRRYTDNSCESSGSFDGEAAHFRRLLIACQEELEEMREKYREVDEECETCAQYLKEREEQCLRLKKEKGALEKTIVELKLNLKNSTSMERTFRDASVNTEEDWTNLHSVFVDRMSYDAEVEKNKKLMRTIEELRYKKQDLKNTMTKMQKALDLKVNKDSQESQLMESELAKCKQELEELQERYKELDEECETCAEYLRERDEQCKKLKEAKVALEMKLDEYQHSSIVQTARKRRQTLHDQNRPTPGAVDAATDTGDDFSSGQVETDPTKLKEDETKEIQRLKMVVEKLSQQKSSLEHQLGSVGPQYVATGSAIVQNQQISDVMKENQKLKKINSKLVTICKKRGKSLMDIENEDPSQNTNKD